MATKLEYFVQYAIKTIRDLRASGPGFKVTDFNGLRSLTNQITLDDISRLRDLLKQRELNRLLEMKRTSIDYFPIHEDDSVSVGVFLLKENAKLPIHDHPGMYGIIKVLLGNIQITSYSFVDDVISIPSDYEFMYYTHPIKVIKHPQVKITKEDECCFLTPCDKNFHKVECVEGPAAFLDILTPPYADGTSQDPRSCHYFEEMSPEGDLEIYGNYRRLEQIPNPL